MSGSMSDLLAPPSGSGALSSFASALSDPGVDALLGMAQGFAQAAMPTRMPTPFGAVLGMGGGGALQGLKTSQQLQQGQQQLLGQRVQNLTNVATLPATLAQLNLRTQMLSDPKLLQSVMGGSGTQPGTPTLDGTSPAVSGAMSASDLATKINYAENATGNPAAPNASGPGGTPTSSAVGNGQFLKDTWLPLFKQAYPDKASGMTDDQILAMRADPATSSAMTVAYAQQNAGVLQNKGIAPTAANLALAHRYGPDGAVSLLQAPPTAPVGAVLGQGVVTANPSLRNQTAGNVIGNATMRFGQLPVDFSGGAAPVASPGINGANALTMANQYEAQANALEGQNGVRKFLGLPPLPGDPAALRTAAQQYRTTALAGPTAAAQSAAKAPFENTRVNPGGVLFDANGNVKGYAPIQSDEVVMSGPNMGTHVTVLRNPLNNTIIGGAPPGATTMPANQVPASAGGSGPETPNGLPAGSIPKSLNPVLTEFMHERGETLAQQFNKIDADAASAKEGNYLFDNLRNDSQSWDMGKFADWEGDGRAWLSAAGHAFGLPDSTMSGIDKPLADYQAFLKSSGSLLRTAVHDVSSRAAVQEYNLIGQTLPQPTTSQQGFAQVADQWQGANDFRLAKQKFAQSYEGHPQDFNVDFNTQVSPVSFMLNRMAMTPQGQQDMTDMLGRMQQTAGGRLAARHMLQQYTFAKQNNLFDGLPETPPITAPLSGGQ